MSTFSCRICGESLEANYLEFQLFKVGYVVEYDYINICKKCWKKEVNFSLKNIPLRWANSGNKVRVICFKECSSFYLPSLFYEFSLNDFEFYFEPFAKCFKK